MERSLNEVPVNADKTEQLSTPMASPPKVSNTSDQPRRSDVGRTSDIEDKESTSKILTTPAPVHYHHRRKRSRVSPLSRLSYLNDYEESSTYPDRACGQTLDGQHHLDPIKDSSDERSPDESAENETLFLNLTPLDTEFCTLLNKYVRSDFVVRSLELAGFTSPYVLIRLDETQLQKMEEFVGHACSSIKSLHLREQFVGPIFCRNPTRFKLPAGAVCGILLAAGELRRKYRRTQFIPSSNMSTDLDNNFADDNYDPGYNEASCQTDVTFPLACPNGAQVNSASYANDVQSNNHPNLDVDSSPSAPSGPIFPADTSRTIRTNIASTGAHQNTGSPNQSLKLDASVPTTSAGTAAIVAAAIQAAAAAVTVPNLDSTLFAPHSSETTNSGLDAAAVSFASGLNTAFPSTFPNDLCMGLHNSLNASAVRSSSATNNLSMPTTGANANSSLGGQSNFVMATSANGGFDEELVDLERLKQHSSASAIRLASRQFINAYLMRGRDFDLEMELSITPEGCKRVTGIFYCHLCREKRERTSAVRFSIARNRYPVLSNVLSHLKTHFHYRGSMVSAPHHSTNHQHYQSKTGSNINDSFINSRTAHSPNSFPNQTNCSGYRTDLNMDNPCNSSLNQFPGHHIKSESINYGYHMDNGSADDSNHGHGGAGTGSGGAAVYDNLGGSPTQSLSSPIGKCSPQTGSNHNLRLDSSTMALSENVKNNPCNSLAS